MTAFVAPSVMETQFSGQYGNSAVAFGSFSPNLAAVNDTAVLIKLYAGTKIYGARLLTGANGAGTTVDVGLVNVDGTAGASSTQFFAAQASSAVSSAISQTRPYTLAKDAYVVVTFKGATTAATGAGNYLDVVVNYEFRGA